MGNETSKPGTLSAPFHPRLIRALNGTEEYVTQPRHSGHPAHTIVSVAHLTGPVSTITRSHLATALFQSAKKYLYLRALVHFDPRKGQSFFHEATSEELPSLIDAAIEFGAENGLDYDKWKSIIAKELENYVPDLNGTTLPWKVCFMRSSDGSKAALVHVVDHLVEDGRANQIFFTDLLTNLSKAVANEPFHDPKPFPFDEALSSQLRREGSISYLQGIQEFGKLMYRNSYVHDCPPNTPSVPIDSRTYSIHFLTLSKEETSKAISSAKSHSVTVTSMLAGVALKAIKEAFESAESESYYVVVVGIDLRSHYKPIAGKDSPQEGELALFKELFGSHIDVRMDAYGVKAEGTVWDVVQPFDADSKYYVDSKRISRDGLHLESYIPQVCDIATNAKNGRYAMMHYSNRGTWQVLSRFLIQPPLPHGLLSHRWAKTLGHSKSANSILPLP